MSLLKRSGATASSWDKKPKQTAKGSKIWQRIKTFLNFKNRSSLRKTLFLQPLTIIFLSFLAILVIFNLSLSSFIDSQADTAIQNQFNLLDSLHASNTAAEDKSKANIFETTYVIVDKDFKTKYVSTSLYDFSDNDISKTITNYFGRNSESRKVFEDDRDDDYDEDKEDDYDDYDNEDIGELKNDDTDDVIFQKTADMAEVKIDGYTYIVDMSSYSGVLNNYYVRQAKDDETAETYYVFVFANVTPVESMDTWINIILVIIFLVIGLGASLSIYLTARKTDKAFLDLKDYITRVGNREKDLQVKQLPYKEFNEVTSTVQNMNEMIDANQRSQQVFFQNSSHELRTPLMSIQGYAEGIKEGVIKDEKAAASVIYDESQKMAELVDDILTISKMETTQTQLNLETVSIPEIIYDLTWRLKNKADENGITFVHDFENDFIEIQADEKLIERALMNVLANAVRYAKSYISIETKQFAAQLQITISNDGPAIAPEEQKHLFERFYKGSGGNFGIGLSVTKDIIERHGGSIAVTSAADQTSFILQLPLKRT